MFLSYQLFFIKPVSNIPIPIEVELAQEEVKQALEKLGNVLHKNKREVTLSSPISDYHINISLSLEIIYKPEIVDELNSRIRFAKSDIPILIKMIKDHGKLVHPMIYARDCGGIFGDSKEEFLEFVTELDEIRKLTQEAINKVKQDIKNPFFKSKQDLCQKTLNSLRNISRDLQKIRKEIKPISKALWEIRDNFTILDEEFYQEYIK